MTRIVRTAYRYQRPPRKRPAVALEVPAVVKAADPADVRSDNQDGCERQSGWMTLGATGGRA